MSKSPSSTYRVFDSSELDDLTISIEKNCAADYLNNPGLRQKVSSLLGQLATAKYFAGPLDHQSEFVPDGTLPTDLPIIIHIKLGSNAASKAFLYLTDTTTELHIPESFLITGFPQQDDQRHALIRELADGLGDIFDFQWKSAEYGGISTPVDSYDEFWEKYKETIFGRVDYE